MMPKIICRFFDDYAAWQRPVMAFFDRPLIWLLPFYMGGITLAWQSGGGPVIPALIFCVLGSLLSLLSALNIIKSWRKAAVFLLAPSLLALGFAITAASLARPSNPAHLLNYVSEDQAAAPLIAGGYVLDGSAGRPGQNYRLLLDIRELIRPGDDGPAETVITTGKARISLPGGLKVTTGDYLRLPLTPRRLAGFKNPGFTDYEKYWGAQGIWVSGFVKSPQLVTSWEAESKTGRLSEWRDAATMFIEETVPAPAAGLLAAQMVGQREAVDQTSEEIFRALGLSHILSVSGLHLSVWYGLCFWFLRRLLSLLAKGRFKPGPPAAALALIPALFYAVLVGDASPVVRSAVMIAAAALAILALRRTDPWNILALAAWVILLITPYRLFTASFQLSFVATAAMLAVFIPRPGSRTAAERSGWLHRPLSLARLKDFYISLRTGRQNQPFEEEQSEILPKAKKSFLWNAALAAMAGTLGTAPLVAWHFGRVPLAGIMANIIFTAALTFGALVPGLISLMLLPISPEAADLLLGWAGMFINYLMPILAQLAEITGPGLLLTAPGAWFLTTYYLAGWIWLRSPRPAKIRATLAAGLLAIGLLPGLISGQGNKNILRVTVLDVGQGSSVHINMPDGSQMLIDGGGTYNFDPGESIITPYLLHQGIRKLDIIALTHPDQDHLKGLVTVAEYFQPKEIWNAPWPDDISELYRRFLTVSPASQRPPLTSLYQGRRFAEAEAEILWPPPEQKWPPKSPGGSWPNNNGLVLKIKWGGVSFLITGDIEAEAEKALAAFQGDRLRSTVLIAPHHGSRTSLTPEFMNAVQPEWVVFAAGRFNSFGLPHPEALERARLAGAAIWRTDEVGAAVFEVKEKQGKTILTIKPPL